MAGEFLNRALVVGSLPAGRDMLAGMLRSEGAETSLAATMAEAREILACDDIDLAFFDMTVERERDGLELLEFIREKRLRARAIVVAADASVDAAVGALRARAFDFLSKPFHVDEVRRAMRRALEESREQAAAPALAGKSRKNRADGERKLIGKSPAMLALNELIRIVAPSSSTVLIRGESGTGKELVARALHAMSPRAEYPHIPVNCGAIPEDLLESELFGHVRGAFTGAIGHRAGRFVLADRGTIFLDEIGDMSPKLQVKVLRVLQEQELEPVGSGETLRVDVRVVAATNVDLERAVEEKRFREDLYYRLNVIPVEAPPLRERIEDLPLLIRHFIRIFNKRQPRKLEGFSPEAMELLKRNPWPGNVRELENLVERMTILSRESTVTVEDLPEKCRNPQQSVRPSRQAAPPSPTVHVSVSPPPPIASEPSPLPPTLSLFSPAPNASEGVTVDERVFFHQAAAPAYEPPEEPSAEEEEASLSDLVDQYERRLILDALERSGGVKSRTAKMLGIKRTTLVEKMKKKSIAYERE